MTATQTLSAILAARPVLLSGACGTEILRRGVPTPLPLWSAAALLDAPEVVREVHRDHVAAGADVATANTFRTGRRVVAAARVPCSARDLTKRAVALAREGVAAARAGRPVLVAGSMAPVADCYRPDLVPPEDATLRAEHGIHAGNLVAARADFVLVETMNTVREAVAALRACAAAALPAAVSFVCMEGARLLSGEPVAEAARAVRSLSPLAILVNCCPVDVATEALAALAPAAGGIPFGAYANGLGRADDAQGWTFETGTGVGAAAYAEAARGWLALGARWLGGCCGTTPEHVRSLRALSA